MPQPARLPFFRPKDNPPAWASASGTDEFGLWAEFAVSGIAHRMRWIPPGTFMQGSPPEEPGRNARSEALHEVTVRRGLWLGETTVTQALWQAAMGQNPSFFKDPNRPVEQVSWHDSVAFVRALEKLIPGMAPRLPWGWEWEYACRAGTKTPYSFGETMDSALAQGLPDDIHPFPCWKCAKLLEDALAHNWPDPILAGSALGTVPVRSFSPNPWGLYEMHGNVDEWCAHSVPRFPYLNEEDWGPKTVREALVRMPHLWKIRKRIETLDYAEGLRETRGGSWANCWECLRSAHRGLEHPNERLECIGMRLAAG